MRSVKVLLAVTAIAFFSGCYNDKFEELYPLGGVVCDTTVVSFATDLKPILNAKCNTAGCHNSASTTGYDLTTYDGVKAVADNGRLLGSINWTTGFSAMPKSLPKLSDCEISKFTRWVNQGKLNN
jgi:hypothetical protein